MKVFVKIPIALTLVSVLLAGAVSAVSAQSYRGPSGYYMGAAPYDAYAYSGPRRYGAFGSYELGFKGCATDGNYGRTDYSAC